MKNVKEFIKVKGITKYFGGSDKPTIRKYKFNYK